MKFVIAVEAVNSCQAKGKARRKLAQWSYENNTTIIIKSIRVSNAHGKKIVTIYSTEGDGTVHI